MKKALRETQTLRALAVVRFGHRPPAHCTQTHRQDRLQYTAPQLASAQCNHDKNTQNIKYSANNDISIDCYFGNYEEHKG